MITHSKLHRCKLKNKQLRLETGYKLKCSSRHVANIGIAKVEKGSPAAGGWITCLA